MRPLEQKYSEVSRAEEATQEPTGALTNEFQRVLMRGYTFNV